MINSSKGKIFHLLLAGGSVFLTISLILYPEEAFGAAVDGLNIWWEVVFPALLPFFIGAEILMGLGVVHFMGVMLEPFMRPVFNVPGPGSFVVAVGLASGFPIGSILTSKLRREEMLTKTEAERLLCFTNTADPLFMFGAVAVGIFNYPELGMMIAVAHYLSSVSVGLLMRFYKKNSSDVSHEPKSKEHIVVRAFKALFKAKEDDGRPFGQLLGDAIKKSINTLLLVGGFIILFSVIIRVLTVVGVIELITTALAPLLQLLGLSPKLIPSLISGFFEISLGCELAGSLPENIPFIQKIMAVSAVIAWSGLSVHAQVASISSDTDINVIPFILARILHGLLAAIYTVPVVKYLFDPSFPVTSQFTMSWTAANFWQFSLTWFSIIISLMAVITVLSMVWFTVWRCNRVVYFRKK